MKEGLGRCALVVGLLCVLAGGVRASGCMTDYSTPIKKDEVESATQRYTAIFTGTVESFRTIMRPVGPPGHLVVYYATTFRVSRWWKPKGRSRSVTVVSPGYGGLLRPFQMGRPYLVYGYYRPSYVTMGECNPTKPLPDAKADLAFLGPGYPPTNPLLLLQLAIGATLALGAGFYWWRKQSD